MKTGIIKTVLVAAVFSCFCIGVNAAETAIPCDHTALTKAGFGNKGIWRIHHRDGALKDHLLYNRVLLITRPEKHPNGDILNVKAMGAGHAVFLEGEEWTGNCANAGEYAGRYVLIGNIYVKSGNQYSCRHELVITRATEDDEFKHDEVNTGSSPLNQIIIESKTDHSSGGSGCESHTGDAHGGEPAPQAPIHLGHAHGGDD